MNLIQSHRRTLLETVFPGECEIIGPKNLKKVCREEKPALAQNQYGSNMMFGDVLLLLFQALEFTDTALNVYKHLKKEKKEATPEKIINITIVNYNMDVSRLSDEKQLELVQSAMKLGETNE